MLKANTSGEQDRTSLSASTLCFFNVSLEIPLSSVETELCPTQWIRAQHSNIDGPRDSYCCPVAKSCPTFCSPVDCNTTGFHVLHYLSEFARTHVHWVNDAIQPSYPLLSLSPPTLNLSQHQGLLQWVGSSHQFFFFKYTSVCIDPSLPVYPPPHISW